MAAPSLYRRYRPRNFAQVRGQDHVVGAMLNAVASGTEGHAYLFSGPRGTGKTSTARILAKALNCEDLRDGEPCCECDSCRAIEAGSSLDLFELDAASNNKVDDMRSLIGGTVVSSPGRTKVYILDEVHMLSAGASNALLKTLEEPPSGVCFVLATTDPNKVLPTIRSRTQHFEFRLLSAAELESYVRWIAEDAGLDLTDEAVAHVVRVGRGSARDTLSALDQVVAAGGVASYGRRGWSRRPTAARTEERMAASVLVVDDEPNIVLSLEFLMRQAGYDVRVARDGDAALVAIAERAPDLVLLDVMMPGRDGYEVCQAIRADPACASTRIVMLTARSREVEREKGLAMGADDYVTKPFSTRALVERVQALLAARRG